MFSFIKKVFGKRDVSDGKVQETPSWDETVKAAEVAPPDFKPASKAKTAPKAPKVVAKTTAVKAKAAAITPTQTAPTKKKVQPKK